MKKIFATFVFVLMLGTLLWNPGLVLAGEHGGSTVPESGAATAKEHGGTAVEGSHSHVATIREAASILKATHPDLAAKLEAIAAEEE